MPDIFLICFDISSQPADSLADFGLLSPEEKKRADRLLIEKKRLQSANSRFQTKLILSIFCRAAADRSIFDYREKAAENLLKTYEELSAANFPDVKNIRLASEKLGKPYLPSSSLSFNLSHSEGLALLALSVCGNRAQLGADLEKIQRSNTRIDIAERFFTEEESEFIKSIQDREKLYAEFTSLWTRKEACCKMWGTGLRTSLSSFSVLKDNVPFPESKNKDSESLCRDCMMLKSFDPENGFKASAAADFIPDAAGFMRISKDGTCSFRYL